MKVLITGATGYIGFNAAIAYRRAGHEVWGLVRSADKASMLMRHEIHPVFGTMEKPESYLSVAQESSILVHAAADYRGDMSGLDKKTVEALLGTVGRGPRPKTIIYTSGCWVNGSTGRKLVNETMPLNPPKLVAWRPAVEKLVMEAEGVKGIVIRPGVVYGKKGGLTAMWFAAAYKEKALSAVGDGSNYWAMVHVDDLAEAYVAAGESSLDGEAFNVNDRSRWTVSDMVNAVARVTGYGGEIKLFPVQEASKTMGDLAECLALDQYVDDRKAYHLLGWQPRHRGFVDEVETYFESWKAFQ